MGRLLKQRRVHIITKITVIALVVQIQRNLACDSSVQEVQKMTLVGVDRGAKVGASLGYNVRTLLKDLGLEVTFKRQF